MFNWLIGTNKDQRDFTIKFELENNTEPQELNLPRNYGVYQVLVEPVNNLIAPSAVFFIARRNGECCGQVVRIISAKGNNNGQLDMCWPVDKFPHLQYKPVHYKETEELTELDTQIKHLFKQSNTDIHRELLEKKRLELIKNQPKVEYSLRFIGV